MERALESSTLFTFAPKIGGRATTAVSIPGKFTSSPKVAWPFSLKGVSRRLMGFPISLKFFGSFSSTLAGGGSFTASATSWP